MPTLNNAAIAAKLKGDNRTVVATPDQTNAGKLLVATDVGPDGVDYGLTNASTSTAAGYSVNQTEAKVTIPEGAGNLDAANLRTQWFQTGLYDSSQVGFGAKQCFVNKDYQPLDANGLPTTVANAVDASTTDLTALGEAVTNWAQCIGEDRTPPPGTYEVTALQTAQYGVPYTGWTVQHDI